MGDQKGGDKTSPPRYVKTWDSSVAHSQYPRSKQMTPACREHSARDRATAHGGVGELEGILPVSMGIGDLESELSVEPVSEKIPRASVLLPFSYFFL